ncbi:MAG: class I SAM-dependent methyltransferase [Actinobacteria bacterium]|nr:class I SAM-dependent methyltransferase [Actinomycetota bacterium]
MAPTIKHRYNPLYSSADTEQLVMSLPTAAHLYELVHTFLSSHLGTSKTILIANSGGLNETKALQTSNPTWQMAVYQPDDAATSQNESSNRPDQFSVSGLSSLLLDDSIDQLYDGAFCNLLLHFLDNETKLKLLKSISSHLKPGSPFVLVTLTGDRAEPEFDRQLDAWKMTLDKSNGILTINSEAEANQVKTLPLVTQGTLSKLLEDSGFEQSTLFYATYFCRGWVLLKR